MLTTPSLDSLSVEITETILVRAPIHTTFESILVQIGRQNELPDGTPFPMVIEPRPGGRWYRDLGSAVIVRNEPEGRRSRMGAGWKAWLSRIRAHAEGLVNA